MKFTKTTLADISIGKGQYGIGASAVDYSDNLYTYLRITDINDDGTLNINGLKSVDDERAYQYVLKPNDIVFARTGNSTGRSYFYDGSDGILVYAGFLIKFSLDSNKVNPKYMKYYCLSDIYKEWITSHSTGSTRGNINAQTYANMEIVLPPREQQDMLVNILEVISLKIKNNNEINRNLSEQAKSIFNQISSNAIESKELKEFIHIKHGFAFKGDFISTEDNNIVLVTPGNFKIGGGFKEEKCKFYNGEIPNEYILKPGSLIVTMTDLSKATDTLGYGALVPDNDSRIYLHNQRIGLVEFISDRLPKEYIYWYFRSSEYQKNIANSATGTTVKHTSPDRICMQRINIPEEQTLKECSLILEKIDFEIANNNLQNIKLTKLKDTLLPKLMSGELDVSDLDI